MRRYMPLVGRLGLDMMTRTCTVQVNLDFSSEEDMVRKLRTSMLLQPVATALFANSPFTEGKPNGYLSYRAQVWNETDPDRTGMPEVFFEPGFGFERYVEWALDVPMYFIHRNGKYIDLAGQSFRQFMERGLVDAPGEVATMGDFADHLTTVFPEVRLKRFLEMRGADAGTPAMMLAQSAFWVGLLYDEAALAAAHAVATRYDWRDYAALRNFVPRFGLATPWHGSKLHTMAGELVGIAADGLQARACRNRAGEDERIYLAPLEEILAGGPVQAEYWLDRFHHSWNGDVRPILKEAAVRAAF
jgi:glutamate--cysteine ligase